MRAYTPWRLEAARFAQSAGSFMACLHQKTADVDAEKKLSGWIKVEGRVNTNRDGEIFALAASCRITEI